MELLLSEGLGEDVTAVRSAKGQELQVDDPLM
jgi:hypothetical protein